MDSKKKLNPEQLKAIRHKYGPLLVIAGAGTGKTTVIVERFKYLISQKLAKPTEILALTFTEKASREMEQRIDEALPLGYSAVWISTFHSFCEKILRQEAINIGLNPRFVLFSEAETHLFFQKNFWHFAFQYFRPAGNPFKFISGLIHHFSRLQDEDISPNDYLFWTKNQSQNLTQEEEAKFTELANAYLTYEKLKNQEGFMDFGDLIVKTLALFRSRPGLLDKYRKMFRFILVDEFQDTNFAQNELALLLAAPKNNISVVGDDDQAVYRFRGASISNILQFKKRLPKTYQVVLTKNYRSSQKILDAAYRLIQFNNPDRLEIRAKIDKKLLAMRQISGKDPETIFREKIEDEAFQVALKIQELTQSEKIAFGDIAILVRANAHADPFIRNLARLSIPFQFLGPGQLFHQDEIKDLIAYLWLLNNFEDSPAFFRIVNLEIFDINRRDLAALGNFAKKLNLSLFEASEKIASDLDLPINIERESREKIQSLVQMIHRHLGLIPKETAGQILYFFLEESGLLKKFLKANDVFWEKKVQNIAKFFDRLKTFENTHRDASVTAVVEYLKTSLEITESPMVEKTDWQNQNAVNILTIHSSKGLEFPVVFLVNLVDQRFPSLERREQIPLPDDILKEILPLGDFHLEEERRLFYVGLTRARDLVFLSGAKFYADGKREKKISPLVLEALDRRVAFEIPKVEEKFQLDLFEWTKPKDIQLPESLKPPVRNINYLSFSQIETFKTCPLHYKLRYLLKVPSLPNHALTFGETMHKVLRAFYEKMLSHNKPSRELLEGLLKNFWNPLGFENKKHEGVYREKGQKMLRLFLAGFDPKKLPLALEYPFMVKLGDLKVGGKIDRIDKTQDGIEIIDYKTGEKIPEQKEVDKNLQLTIYALSASKITDSLFHVKPENITLSLVFLDQMKIIRTYRTADQLKSAEEELKSWAEKIATSDYQCSRKIICQKCEYKILCSQI